MDIENLDVNGVAVKKGDKVMFIQGCNFIFGTVNECLEDGRFDVSPDGTWITAHPNFKVKEKYIVDAKHLSRQ